MLLTVLLTGGLRRGGHGYGEELHMSLPLRGDLEEADMFPEDSVDGEFQLRVLASTTQQPGHVGHNTGLRVNETFGTSLKQKDKYNSSSSRVM